LIQNTEQSCILPFFDDNHLLSGQSRITKLNFQSLTSCNNRKINYEIHHGFTSDEEILIRDALQIIDDRLFKPEILENMYQICGTSCQFLGPRVWSRSQLRFNNNYHGTHDLLRFQLMCLKLKGENGQFPTIHIYPIYEKTDTQSEATVGCISCISHGSTFSIEGKFTVKLNRYNLNASDKNPANRIYWAGTIVHEMLHNLGHKHKDNDYSNQWQINIFENSFIYNGNYSPEEKKYN
jgi:hypothetical protein